MRSLQKLRKYLKYSWVLLVIIAAYVLLNVFGVLPLKPKTQPPAAPTPAAAQSPLYDSFHLLIPSLDISAPVIPDVDGANQKAYDKALEGGVAQLSGSAKPGEGSNIFIFGHSSFYWYKPGDYKKVFATLNKLKKGDKIILWYDKKEHQYAVSETKIISPSGVDVIKPTKEEQVTLMTCWPPNTTQKRLIVIAKPE